MNRYIVQILPSYSFYDSFILFIDTDNTQFLFIIFINL